MWHQLRSHRALGVKFRRQKVIGQYIVDFAANEPKLVIEIDGATHADREAEDAVRTRYLEQEGYTVIRFSNSNVCKDMDGVMLELALAVDSLRNGERLHSPPPPTPSPKGEGAS